MRKIAIGGMFFLSLSGAAYAADPLGEWRDEDGKATIRIVDCGTSLWGIIASEKTPGLIDKNNPDKAKQSRTTMGMPILLDMTKSTDEKDTWEGKIYDPTRGKLFDASIVAKTTNSLKVEGCVAMVLCGGQTWTRVEPGTSGFTYGPLTPAKAGAMSPPGAPKMAPAPMAAPAATKAPAGAKGVASSDPVTAQICALPEIAAATAKRK
jgi:uncharacterized protein (DUF2147 family)